MRLLITLMMLSVPTAFAEANPFMPPTEEELVAMEQCNPATSNPIEIGLRGGDGSDHQMIQAIQANSVDYTDAEKYRFVANVNGIDIYYDINNKNYIEKKQ
ncbi:hypothetical protein [Vibrio owensii]|uniref:hypothetical protein n=1 Tax=Vibrio owensii TaxID=696485 RepID=UPI003CC60908